MTNRIREPDACAEARPRCGPVVLEHWVWLILCSAIVVAAFSLEVRGSEQVGSAFGPDFVLPSLCLYRNFLGLDCPGCGLTCSFIYLAQGDLRASWEMHYLGWLFALIVAGQIPYRICRLCWPGKLRIGPAAMFWLSAGMSVLILGAWLIKLILTL